MTQRVKTTIDGKTLYADVGDDFDFDSDEHKRYLEWVLREDETKNKTKKYGDAILGFARDMTIKPIGEMLNSIDESRESGSAMVKDALATLKAGDGRSPLGAVNMALGAAQWVLSPYIGALESLVGKPVTEAAQFGLESYSRARGVDEETIERMRETQYGPADFIGDTLMGVADVALPLAWTRRLSDLSGAVRSGVDVRNPAKTPPVTTVQQKLAEGKTYKQIADEAPEETSAFVPRASVDLTSDITTNPTLISRVEKIRSKIAEEGGSQQRLYKDIGDEMYQAIKSNELPLSSISRLLDDLEMDPEEFVKAWQQSIRESGQSLNLLSQAAKRMSKDMNYPSELRANLNLLSKEISRDGSITNTERFFNVLRRVENFRRGMMVSQLKTAVRNGISAVGRLTIGTFDDALQTVYGGGSIKELWNSISSDMKSLPLIRNKQLLNDVLDGNPIPKDRLLNTTAQEVDAINKVARLANSFNIYQERAFRKFAFQARLEKLAKEAGVDLKAMDPNNIPDAWLDNAINHALDMTFASSGGKMARQVTSFYDQFPFLYTISNPFPRFQFANVLPFLAEHSPYGFAKALSPSVMKDLASGDAKTFSKAASRATVGTVMLGGAMDLYDKFGGDKWYELNLPQEDGSIKAVDVRAYAPITTYLYFAHLIDESKKMAADPNYRTRLEASDITNVLAGLDRVGGSALVLADVIRSPDFKNNLERGGAFFGDWLGSFTTPIAQLRDIEQAVSGDATLKDTRGDTPGEKILSPTVRNLPIAEELLPDRVSPLRQDVIRPEPLTLFGVEVPGGIASQVTGLTIKNKNELEQEVGRLNIDYSSYMPRNSNKQLNRLQIRQMTEWVPAISEFITTNPRYLNLSDTEKRYILEELLSSVKSESMKSLQGADVPQSISDIILKERGRGAFRQSERDVLREHGIGEGILY